MYVYLEKGNLNINNSSEINSSSNEISDLDDLTSSIFQILAKAIAIPSSCKIVDEENQSKYEQDKQSILNLFKCVQFSRPLRSFREKQFDKSK